MIFSDPAAMGLYFMGAIVLFEKSERVLDSVAVSPVKPWEYVLSKLVSVAVVSTLVAAAIGFAAGIDTDIFRFFISIFLCSCLFSSVGLIVATKISTLNGFIVATIPAELIINIPAVAWLFGYQKAWLLFHPGVCMITLCSDGKYNFSAMVILIFWTVLFAVLASRAVGKMMRSVGAIKL
ncbi:ABC transporter permease [bacterium]|nr:ABC transporter permease [bacterium]